ncbi:WecB/TagA/CpsF family glycosyltransferase [Candidatus Uabimicrobium amorphum]|uniref:Acetylglucosaminyldiphosphoundecaprenolacetyl-beta-D-mannosaminyltransferase n=1 Tax=Uabimicrobium amorphum TaxID=2596890 RepID=A0A5S9ISU0_UABAM|nr:WecB/TagA/CpsF family glycosyltransferase [Candidatus Uabimicrobium amorphum]BBM86901.1 acetylglucosaminyldiphosphoundecaprenolacetyl-beta-D-mannosaminyltransferase [Candidatus Uabimicrobium amorphum]
MRDPRAEELYRRFSRKGIARQRIHKWLRSFTWVFTVQLLGSVKRVVDFVIALCLLLLFLPVIFLYMIFSLRLPKVDKIARLGRWGIVFYEYKFKLPNNMFGKVLQMLRFHRLPAMWNVVKGDMSLIGPSLVSPQKLTLNQEKVRRRCSVRPGFICLWWIRKRANIDYETELDVDNEYIERQSFRRDLGIALRSIPAMMYGKGVKISRDYINIFGILIRNVTMDEAIEEIMDVMDGSEKKQFCFVNPDCANIAYKNRDYFTVLKNCHYVLGDGIGIKIAGKLLGNEIKQNVNGTDLFPRLCEKLQKTSKSLFLLGAREEVIQGVASWVKENYPNLTLAGYRNGYFTQQEQQQVIEQINDSKADLLLVAFGAPKQEKWIAQNQAQLHAKVAIGVGGLFDFYSGRMPRAPQWMREIGMEWVYRLYNEPRRLWRRYVIGNVVFLYRVMKQKLRGTTI